jgi:hypothetical protein
MEMSYNYSDAMKEAMNYGEEYARVVGDDVVKLAALATGIDVIRKLKDPAADFNALSCAIQAAYMFGYKKAQGEKKEDLSLWEEQL